MSLYPAVISTNSTILNKTINPKPTNNHPTQPILLNHPHSSSQGALPTSSGGPRGNPRESRYDPELTLKLPPFFPPSPTATPPPLPAVAWVMGRGGVDGGISVPEAAAAAWESATNDERRCWSWFGAGAEFVEKPDQFRLSGGAAAMGVSVGEDWWTEYGAFRKAYAGLPCSLLLRGGSSWGLPMVSRLRAMPEVVACDAPSEPPGCPELLESTPEKLVILPLNFALVV